MDDFQDLVGDFLVECQEGLERFDRDLIALEGGAGGEDTLSSAFRVIHSIKGASGFLNLARLEQLTHAGETLLGKMRDGLVEVTPDMVSGLLAMSDAIRAILASVERGDGEGEGEDAELVGRLDALAERGGTSSEVAVPVPAATSVARSEEEGVETAGGADASIRVDVHLLDLLMNLVGELVLARNRIVQLTGNAQSGALAGAAQRLNLITTELQEGVMRTRMQPVATLWGRLPRIVRDLAMSCGKQVELVMEGQDTELDKSLLEAIKDPLTHLIRNAVDHGVETPDERVAAGKPAAGRLFLRAYHEGGQVHIEVNDDGAGIDVRAVRARALERGVVTADQLERLSEREVLDLVFLPGFSTAASVTNLSGRGVGMDVVRTNIERIGGTVEIQTQLGHGTTFRLTIPLTLAIIPALVVTAGRERYAIPQISLVELVRLQGEHARKGIEWIHGAPVFRLRGQLLPVVDLHVELGLPAGEDRPVDVLNLVVVRAEGRSFALVVDDVTDTQEIVVKPMSKQLKNLDAFAGATIMGDGRVALILDVLGIARRARVVGDVAQRAQDDLVAGLSGAGVGDRRSLLLVRSDEQHQVAVPLDEVARLEQFPADMVELAGDREVAQYRGRILPLVRLEPLLGLPFSSRGDGVLNVVVHGQGQEAICLVVGEIVDIVDSDVELDRTGARPGVAGTAVLQGRVTEVLDVAAVARSAGFLVGV